MIRIGLTGNIASGKSTVAAMLAELGAMVVDADRVAHEVMRPGTGVYYHVVQRFGESILAADYTIDRKALGAIVFADSNALKDLDHLVHPAMVKEVEELIAACQPPPPVAVVEAVKLVEAGMHRNCDSVWLVTCSAEIATRRLMYTRQLTREEAQARLQAQGSDAQKRLAANVIIDNDGDLASLRQRVEEEWKKLARQAC